MATQREAKEPKTLIVWTDTEVLVEFVVMTAEDAALRAQSMASSGSVEDVEEDHCWQVLDGHARVSVRTAGKDVRAADAPYHGRR